MVSVFQSVKELIFLAAKLRISIDISKYIPLKSLYIMLIICKYIEWLDSDMV